MMVAVMVADCDLWLWLAVQVATTATFAACALEALRMLLADLEQPGGTLTTPIKAPMALLLPTAIALFPVALPAGFIGEMVVWSCHSAAGMCAAVSYALHSAVSFEITLHMHNTLLLGVHQCSSVPHSSEHVCQSSNSEYVIAVVEQTYANMLGKHASCVQACNRAMEAPAVIQTLTQRSLHAPAL